MVTQEKGAAEPKVKTKMSRWVWGAGAILVALLAFAGVQMMSAQQKSEETNRLLQAARTAHMQAEAKAKEAQRKLSEETAKLRAMAAEAEKKLSEETAKLQARAEAMAEEAKNKLSEETAKLRAQAGATAEETKTRLSAENAKLRAEMEKLKATLDDTVSKLEKAQADARNYRRRARQLEAERFPAQ